MDTCAVADHHARVQSGVPAPVDRLGRGLGDLRISVTDRCNFRCPYCMPAEIYGERYEFLPKPEILTFEEIARLASVFVGLGVRKLRITGGEPLLRADLPRLVEQLAALDGVEDLALTTNGSLLEKAAPALVSAGLQRVTVSLDSLDPATFAEMSGGRHDPAAVLAGIDAADAAGLAPIKINCVVTRGVNEDAVLPMAERFRGSGHVVRFIEYMDVGTLNAWSGADVFSADEIVATIGERYPLEALPPSQPGEVATRYRYSDGAGEIGVIASVTKPFCGGCTRARLTTDGRLVTCLFAADGMDLKTPLRAGESPAALARRIGALWGDREDRYSELRGTSGASPDEKVEMFQIGG